MLLQTVVWCFVFLHFNSLKSEVIETACHILTANSDSGNDNLTISIYYNASLFHNFSCQCKPECGSSKRYQYSVLPNLNRVLITAALLKSGELNKYPLWLLEIVEDYDLFKDQCKCRISDQKEWSYMEKRFFDLITWYFAQNVINAFYTDIPITPVNYLAWVYSIFNIFYPVFLLSSIFNIIILYKLSKNNKAMAFTFQLFQFVASAFSLIFQPSWTLRFAYLFINTVQSNVDLYYNYLTTVFTLWTQLMSLTLLLDRFFCVWKPFLYKNTASKKWAIKVSLILLLVSVVISATLLINIQISDVKTSTFVAFLASLLCTAIFIFGFFVHLILVCFLLILLNRANMEGVSLQTKKRQRNLNRILICTAVTESLLNVCHTVSKIAFTGLAWAAYNNWIDRIMDFLLIFYYVMFYSPPLIGIAPFVSLMVCFALSKMYRQAVYSMFKFRLNNSNSVQPSTTDNVEMA